MSCTGASQEEMQRLDLQWRPASRGRLHLEICVRQIVQMPLLACLLQLRLHQVVVEARLVTGFERLE